MPEDYNEQLENTDFEQHYTEVEPNPQNVAETEIQFYHEFIKGEHKTSRDPLVYFDQKKKKIISVDRPTLYKETITRDIATSNLDDYEAAIIRDIFLLNMSIQQYATIKNLDLSRLANYFNDVMHGLANISKGKNFGMLRLMRTSRTEAFSEHQARSGSFDAPKKQGILGKIFR